VVSAEQSKDLNKKPLTFTWVVLQGDPEKINIETADGGKRAEITVAFHHRFPVSPNSAMETNRVDIGVFAHNGKNYSAPAFVTFTCLDNEARTYGEKGQPVDIYFRAGDTTIGFHSISDRDLIEGRYDIYNWTACLDRILSDNKDFPVSLLKEQFKPEEIKVITETAATFRECMKERKTLKEDPVQEKYKKARSDMHAKRNELKKIEADHKKKKTEETEKALAAVKREYDAAVRKEKEAKKELSPIEKKLRDNERKMGGLLKKKHDSINMSVKSCIEQKLNTMRTNVMLYFTFQKDIHTLAGNSADAKKKEAFIKARQEGVKAGVLKINGESFDPCSIHSAELPLEKRLTRYEKNRIYALNTAVMTNILFPGFLRRSESVNYTDFRLGTPRNWREIFTYNETKDMTGWIRLIGEKKTEFDAQGQMIIEKDDEGKPVKVKQVEYKLEFKNKRRPWERKIVIKDKPIEGKKETGKEKQENGSERSLDRSSGSSEKKTENRKQKPEKEKEKEQ
jgi:hypothetical protein